MSSVDQRVVEMQFNNSQFEDGIKSTVKSLDSLKKNLKMDDSIKSIEELEKKGDSFSLARMASSIEAIEKRFSVMGIAGMRAIQNVVDSAMNAGKRLTKSLSVDQITSGWSKYVDKTGSVQTIMNATGKSVEEVNDVLDKLMWFSDETSYNFSEMTSALGTMTSSGGNIEKLIPMIEGMATATAFAGKGASEFSRIIYNLNQSYGQGYLSLMDWKSVELAGVGSEQLKQTLMDAAVELGTLKKLSDGTYKTLKGTIVTVGTMGSTLNEKWATRDVMESGFGKFSEVIEEAYRLVQEGKFDTAADAIASLEGKYSDVSYRAATAAQEAKSFREAIEATKDAVSSGWMKTFELIFGNKDEATELWTDVANALWEVFASGGEARNEMFQLWKDAGGREDLIQGITDALTGLWNIIEVVKDAFAEIFPPITAETLTKISKKIRDVGANLKETFKILRWQTMSFEEIEELKEPFEELNQTLKKGARGDDVKRLQERLKKLGYDIGPAGPDGVFGKKTQEALKQFQEEYGLTVDGIYNADVHKKLEETFNGKGTAIEKIIENFKKNSPVLEKIKSIASGFFSILKIGGTILKFVWNVVKRIFGVFKPFGSMLLTIGARLGDTFTKLADKISKSDKFEKWLNFLDEKLKPISEWAEKAANSILKFLGIIEDPKSKTGGFMDTIKSAKDKFDSIKNFFSDSKAIDGKKILDKTSGFFDTIKNIFGSFITWTKTNVNIKSFLSNFDMMDILITAAGVITALLLGNVLSIVNNVRKTIKSISAITSSISDYISNIRKGKMFSDFSNITTGILKLVAAIAILAGVVYLFSRLSVVDILKGLGGIAVLVGILVGSLFLIDKVSRKIDVKKLEKTMTILISFSIVVAILSAAVAILGKMDMTSLLKGIFGLAAVLATMVVFSKAISKVGKIDSSSVLAIVAVSSAILTLVKSVVILGNLDSNTLSKGILGMAAIMMSLGIFIKSLGKIKISITTLLSIIPIVLAIDMLIAGFIALTLLTKFIDSGTMIKSMATLTLIMFSLATFMKSVKKIKMGPKDIVTILSIVPIVIAIDSLIVGFAIIALLSKIMKASDVIKSLLMLGGIMASLAIFLKACGKIKPSIGSIIGIIPMVMAIDTLILGFAILALTMKIIDNKTLLKAFAAFTTIIALLAVFAKACEKIKPSIGSIIGIIPMVIAINTLILGFAILALTMKIIDNKTLLKALVSLAGLTAILVVFMRSLNSVNPNIKGVLALIPAALALSIVIIAFSSLLKHSKEISSEKIIALSVSLGLIFSTIGMIISVSKNMTIKGGLSLLVGCIGMVVVIAAFVMAINSIKDVDTDKIITIFLGITSLLGEMVILSAVASAIGLPSMVKGSLAIGLAFAILVGIITAVVTILGAINTLTNGGFLGIIQSGGQILEAVGEAVGSLFGGFVKGLINPIGESLNSLADGLSKLNDIDDLDDALNKAMYAITTLAKFTVKLSSMNIERNRGALVKFFIGENKTNSLLDQIKKFGETIGSVYDALGGIGNGNFSSDVDTAISAAREISRFLEELSGVDIKTHFSVFGDWFGGKSKQETILGLIEEFGVTMGLIKTELASYSDSDIASAVTNAVTCAGEIENFLEQLENVDVKTHDTVFGDWFGGESKQAVVLDLIDQFGTTMGTVATSLNGVGKDLPTATGHAVTAAGQILDFIQTLPKVEDLTEYDNIIDEWFSGTSKEAHILELIDQFGTTIGTVASSLNGVGSDLETATEHAITAANKILEFIQTLPTVEDLTEYDNIIDEWFSGTSKESKILDYIGQFGTTIGMVVDALGGDLQTTLETNTTSATNAANTIVEFLEGLPNIQIENKSDIEKWFSGENKQDTILSFVSRFAEVMSTASTLLAPITDNALETNMTSAKTAIENFIGLLSYIHSDDVEIPEVWNEYGDVVSKFSKVMDAVAELGTTISVFDNDTKDADLERITTITGAASIIMDSMTALGTEISGDPVEAVKTAIEKFEEIFSKDSKIDTSYFLESFDSATVSEKMGSFATALTDGLTNTATAITDQSESFKTAGETLYTSLNEGFSDSSLSKASDVCKNMISNIRSYYSSFKEAGKYLGQGIGWGIKDSKEFVLLKTKAVAQAALDLLYKMFDEHSPSKVTYEMGQFLDIGLANGISQYGKVVTRSAGNMATDTLDSMKHGLVTFSSLIEDGINADPVVRPVVDLSNVVASSRTIDGMLSGNQQMNVRTSMTNASDVMTSIDSSKNRQNGKIAESKTYSTNNDNSVSINGNFYVRSDNDIRSLASEIAALTQQQQRSLGGF